MQLQASMIPDSRRRTHLIGGALTDEYMPTNAGAQTSEKKAIVGPHPPSITSGQATAASNNMTGAQLC